MSDNVHAKEQQQIVEKGVDTKPPPSSKSSFNWSTLHKIVLVCQYACLMAAEAGECSLDVALPNAQIDPTTVLGCACLVVQRAHRACWTDVNPIISGEA